MTAGRWRRALAALAVVVAVAGCGGPDHGTVVDKRFIPAHEDTWIWCHAVGKVTVCQPMTNYYDNEWDLLLRLGDDQGWVEVSQSTYDHTQVGDYYGSAS